MESADDVTVNEATDEVGAAVETVAIDTSQDEAGALEVHAAPPQRGWRNLPRSRKISAFVISALVSLGLALIIAGVQGSVTGREQSRLPDEIEQIQPALGDKVLNQANIVVDLAPGYTGRLLIDGLAFPTVSTAEAEPAGATNAGPTTTIPFDPDNVRFDAGNNTLSYQPRPGGTIERFEVGRHTAKVIYWKIVDGEAQSYSYFWYFDVTA